MSDSPIGESKLELAPYCMKRDSKINVEVTTQQFGKAIIELELTIVDQIEEAARSVDDKMSMSKKAVSEIDNLERAIQEVKTNRAMIEKDIVEIKTKKQGIDADLAKRQHQLEQCQNDKDQWQKRADDPDAGNFLEQMKQDIVDIESSKIEMHEQIEKKKEELEMKRAQHVEIRNVL